MLEREQRQGGTYESGAATEGCLRSGAATGFWDKLSRVVEEVSRVNLWLSRLLIEDIELSLVLSLSYIDVSIPASSTGTSIE